MCRSSIDNLEKIGPWDDLHLYQKKMVYYRYEENCIRFFTEEYKIN